MKWNRLLLAICTVFLVAACAKMDIPQPPQLNVSLPVAGAEEAVWSSSEHQGQPVLVAVMASYCGWCKRSLPALEAANAEFKDKGVEVVGIYVDDDEDAVLDIINQYGLKSTILYQGGQAAQDLMVQGFPHIMLFDKDHNMIKIWSGYSDTLAEEYQKEINKLLD